jgi:hypothetical protein
MVASRTMADTLRLEKPVNSEMRPIPSVALYNPSGALGWRTTSVGESRSEMFLTPDRYLV